MLIRLVTSDQMARGIDIPVVDYVVSYDLPGYTKTYIHRIGRTARAGKEGTAISLVLQNQVTIVHEVLHRISKGLILHMNMHCRNIGYMLNFIQSPSLRLVCLRKQ